jgi:hypothetical protein
MSRIPRSLQKALEVLFRYCHKDRLATQLQPRRADLCQATTHAHCNLALAARWQYRSTVPRHCLSRRIRPNLLARKQPGQISSCHDIIGEAERWPPNRDAWVCIKVRMAKIKDAVDGESCDNQPQR